MSTLKVTVERLKVVEHPNADALELAQVGGYEFHQVCAEFDLPPVPILYDGPFDLDALKEVATGTTKIGGGNIREGVVVRPHREGYSPVTGGRAIAKLVSPAYLLRKGEVTEYE